MTEATFSVESVLSVRNKAPKFNRFMATILDYFFLILMVGVFFGLNAAFSGDDGVSGDLIFATILLFFVGLLFRDSFSGQSLGKRCLGLQVIDVKTNLPASAGQSFLRNFLFLFKPMVFVELIVLMADQNGRRLGDQCANTVVVEKNQESGLASSQN